MSQLYAHPQGSLFPNLWICFSSFSAFEIDERTASQFSDDDILRSHYAWLQALQILIFKQVPKFKELALTNVGSIEKRTDLTMARKLSVLSPDEIKDFVVLSTKCKLYLPEGCLALPKLNLQFLTLHDYRLRNFNLFRIRLESTYETRENISEVMAATDRRAIEERMRSFKGGLVGVVVGAGAVARVLGFPSSSAIAMPLTSSQASQALLLDVETALSRMSHMQKSSFRNRTTASKGIPIATFSHVMTDASPLGACRIGR